MDFVYDANGRMAKATRANFPGALSVFDAGGNKVATRVNDVWRFQIYDAGGKCVAEYGGPQQTDDGGVKYTHQDIQGSTRTISTQAGFAQARMDYQAFGEQISSGIGQRTATGYTASDTLRNRYALTERDEATGLDDTWFRKLENRGGRWTSPDPYNGSALVGNPQSFNRYGYVENQPTNYVDPSGLFMIGPRPPAPREQSWLEICWLLGICGNPTTSQGGEDFPIGGGGGPDDKKEKCSEKGFSEGIRPDRSPRIYSADELNSTALTVFGEISSTLHNDLYAEAHAVASEIFNRAISIQTGSVKPNAGWGASGTLSDVTSAKGQFAGYGKGNRDYLNFNKNPGGGNEFYEGERNCTRFKEAVKAVRSIADNLDTRDPYVENRAVRQVDSKGVPFNRKLQPGQVRIGGNDFSANPM